MNPYVAWGLAWAFLVTLALIFHYQLHRGSTHPVDVPTPTPANTPEPPEQKQTPEDGTLALLQHMGSLTADTLTTAEIQWMRAYAEEHGYEGLERAANDALDHKNRLNHYARCVLADTLRRLRADGIGPESQL